MFYNVKAVSGYDTSKLMVEFCCGVTKLYDIEQLYDRYKAFLHLKENPDAIGTAKVDVGGFGISWNDELDLSCNELWDNGETIDTPFDDILSFSDATTLWCLNESTLRKAVTYGKLKNGIDVKKYGKQWVVTRGAMNREYGELK